MKRILSLVLVLVILCGMMPRVAFATKEAETNPYKGKTLSILGDSISTFSGVSNNTTYNSTIGSNAVYYSRGTLGVYRADTWWQQALDALGMELLVNNSWSGSTVFYPRLGEASVGYRDRCVNLHNDSTGMEPDVIVVFLGTNDFSYYQTTLGTSDINYNTLMTDDGYATPATTCEAYAIMLHKMTARYPDAEIYCMGMTARRSPDKEDGFVDVGQPTAFNAELREIIEHFGAAYVDLENCGIDANAEIFDTYMGDSRVHPNALGMDKITQALVSTMLGQNTKLCNISYSLNGVSCDQSAKIALSGNSYTANLVPQDSYIEMDVTVTMGGVDVTADCYSSGMVSILEVTGDITITAAGTLNKKLENYRWEFDGSALVSTGDAKNTLTKQAGTIAGGVFNGIRYNLETPVLLAHDANWSVEWKCSGNWSGMLLTSTPQSNTTGMRFLFRTYNATGLLAIGEFSGQYNNYGIALADLGMDMSATHIYRLENRIADDGSNMVYLTIDGVEIGALNHYYIGGVNNQNKAVDWVSGKDYVFGYIGSTTHPLKNMSLEYLSVSEAGEVHSHAYEATITAPTCTAQGYTTYTCACGDSYVSDYLDATEHSFENGICSKCGLQVSPYLQQLPEDFSGCSNLYDLLTPVKGYYTATKYDTSNGQVLSVVIPVEPGDRIAASSFGTKAENMGSVNGIRVTYLLGDKIVSSLSAGTVYNAYTTTGYITVPEGVDAVSIPWWVPSDRNWLTLSQISKNFATHSPKSVPAQAPTCTESGYTAGEVCEYCGDSLGKREEIPATGHSYDGDTCTVCGKVNVLANLDGKYVSILGDSISTFRGYSNDATVNSTIGGNGPRYDAGAADTKPGSYCLLESVNDTWWMDFANRSGMKLLVNNSWAGSQVFGGKTSDGRVIPAAYLERCVNLHDNTLENNLDNAPIHPDAIFVYLGINDYNFNRSQVGTGAVDYAKLINADGTYATPATFGEAYGILLHKMKNAYPNAQIFAMTLLPENLYSVDTAAWEQHNAYIRAAAQYYGIPLVDLAENCAITWDNYSGYMIDKIHPTTAGMKLISDCIEAELVAYYNHPVGDVNSDGTVSYSDAVYLLLHTLFGGERYPLSGAAADFDGSGAIDQDDAVYLLLHTLFDESFYPLQAKQ